MKNEDEARVDDNITGCVEFIKKMRRTKQKVTNRGISVDDGGEFKAADIIKFREQLALIDQQNTVDLLLLLSEDPSITVQPLLRELKNTDKLLQEWEEKYLQGIENMKANNETDDLGKRLKNEMDSYYSNLQGLYGEV